MSVRFHHLLGLDAPGRGLTAAEVFGRPRTPPDGRPWVMLGMIASIDGATTVQGTSGGLGNAADRAALVALRQAADIIVVGAGTARAENYGAPSKAGQRIAVVSRSGRMDYTSALFASGAGLMIVADSAPEVPVESIRAGSDTVDIAAALAALAADGHQVVQLEGGPSLNGDFAAAGLIDEINLTVAPRVVGGDVARIVETNDELNPAAGAFELSDVYESGGYLFIRWVRASR